MQTLGVEFQIIQRYFAQHAKYDASVALGIGDDCALLIPTPGMWQAISVDTSIAGRHFPEDAQAFDIAYRALNVSLSDLAAMGATARWFTLALSLPEMQTSWLEEFSRGLFQAATHAGVQLIGGDTTKGALSITIQVQGELPAEQALKRSGAKLGDYIYVSRCLGDAGAGLAIYRQQLIHDEKLLNAYLRPEPELVLGQLLLGKANSCIDISDGLLADLSHILRASNVGAEIDLQAIPLSSELLNTAGQERALQLALAAGDDYALCFTSELSIAELQLEDITCIGRIILQTELLFINTPKNWVLQTLGYDHFYENTSV